MYTINPKNVITFANFFYLTAIHRAFQKLEYTCFFLFFFKKCYATACSFITFFSELVLYRVCLLSLLFLSYYLAYVYSDSIFTSRIQRSRIPLYSTSLLCLWEVRFLFTMHVKDTSEWQKKIIIGLYNLNLNLLISQTFTTAQPANVRRLTHWITVKD